MSGYQPQNRLCHYKSYCKYSPLYEAVMGRTKDFNEATKSLKSLLLSLHAAGKQRKDIASPVGCSEASVSRVINDVALKGQAACGKQKKTTPQDHRQLCRIAKTNRFSLTTQLSQLSQKWKCALGQEVSTATTFRRLREMGFRCRKPATKPLLNRKHKLKRLQWANMHKNCTKMHKDGQKSFFAINLSCASSLVIEELWFGEIKMSTTIQLV